MAIIVIGGGPAGMMAGIAAAERGKKVILIEKNEKLGKKIYITGKGRCNLTNAVLPQEFIKAIPTNPKFMLSALSTFSPYDTVSFFEDAGLKLKTERGGRVFPYSDKASDVTATLLARLKKYNVSIKLEEKVVNIEYKNKRITKVITDKNIYDADAVIITTGGLSYPGTGSTGDGYALAKQVGHTLVPPCPALCPIRLKGALSVSGRLTGVDEFAFPAGLSLVNITASIKEKGKVVASEFGELLFTHKGVSGPVVLTLSSLINRKDLSKLSLIIDFKPALSLDTLDRRLVRDFTKVTNKQFKNALGALLPKSLIPYIIHLSEIDPDMFVHSVTKEERLRLVKLLKSLEFPILALGSQQEAIVTAGGVSVKEIHPSSMRSKLVENLYFAGEVIDVDGFTGGYNIQIALSTGRLAGKSV